MESHRHVIIAGANKCGTTSLFRYLAAHPSVQASEIKEARFFWEHLKSEPQTAYEEYLELFEGRGMDGSILLEATPNYLDGGKRIAAAIRRILGRPKIIFILRDPVDRFFSYYRSMHGYKPSPTYGLSFGDCVDIALRGAEGWGGDISEKESALGREILKGRYADGLKEFLSEFSQEDMLILFFDELEESPRKVTQRSAQYAGIEPGFFDDFQFNIENRSRHHRIAGLRTWASLANRKLEPLLNRLPGVRHTARLMYNKLNTSQVAQEPRDERSLNKLRVSYAEHNASLAQLLQTDFQVESLPIWLNNEI